MKTNRNKKTSNNTTEHPVAVSAVESPVRKSHKLRKAAVIAAGGLAVLKGAQIEGRLQELKETTAMQAVRAEDQQRQLDRQTAIIASQNNIEVGVITGESLKSIDSLEAYGSKITPEQRERLRVATVEVGKRQKGSAEPWQLTCTATKVSNGSEVFVMSATHCFTGDLPQVSGKGGGGIKMDALNITDTSLFEYAILDPKIDHTERPTAEPMARVSALALDMYASDLALLRIDSSTTTDEYTEHPAVSFGEFSSVLMAPVPGEQTALYSLPSASNFEPVVSTGVYLGRVDASTEVSLYSSKLDIVAVWPSSAAEDACNFGASGSSAIFAGGVVSGPLSFRNNANGFGSADERQPEDTGGMHYRLILEQQLGLDLTDVPTICGYSQPDERSFEVLQASLDVPGAYLDPNASMK